MNHHFLIDAGRGTCSVVTDWLTWATSPKGITRKKRLLLATIVASLTVMLFAPVSAHEVVTNSPDPESEEETELLHQEPMSWFYYDFESESFLVTNRDPLHDLVHQSVGGMYLTTGEFSENWVYMVSVEVPGPSIDPYYNFLDPFSELTGTEFITGACHEDIYGWRADCKIFHNEPVPPPPHCVTWGKPYRFVTHPGHC